MTTSFTVDQSSLVAKSWVHTLRGTKSTLVTAMTLDSVSGRITFPTTEAWQVDVILSPGTNTFQIRGTDTVSNTTETVEVEVELRASEPGIYELHNDVAKHGALAGIDRLPGEKNVYFQRRIADAGYYSSATNYEGLVAAVARDLGLTSYTTSVQVAVNKDTYQDALSRSVSFEITPSVLLVDADEIYTTGEQHQVLPEIRGFYLTYEPRAEEDVKVYTRDNTLIHHDLYKVYPYEKKVVFENDDYNRAWVVVNYKYREEVANSGTLGDIKDGLEAIQVGGQQLLSVTVDDESRTAEGLAFRQRLGLTTSDENIRWTPVQVYDLTSERFRDSLLNANDAAYGTLLEMWADEIAARSKFGWAAVVLDVDTWDPFYKNRNNAYLPHLFDAYRGYWRCSDPTDTTRYDRSDYAGYSGYCPNHPAETLEYAGVLDSEWQSGVGDGDNLLVTGVDTQ